MTTIKLAATPAAATVEATPDKVTVRTTTTRTFGDFECIRITSTANEPTECFIKHIPSRQQDDLTFVERVGVFGPDLDGNDIHVPAETVKAMRKFADGATDSAELKEQLRQLYRERGEALGWFNAKGKLTKKGGDEALSWLIGVHVGRELAGLPGLGPWIWIASVRGVDGLLELN